MQEVCYLKIQDGRAQKLLLRFFQCVSFFIFLHLQAVPIVNLWELPVCPLLSHPIYMLNNEIVQVKGFWIPLSEKTGVLSCQPNVKSCCLSAKSAQHQLFVTQVADFLPINQVIALEGTFSISSEDSSHEYLYRLHYLKRVKDL